MPPPDHKSERGASAKGTPASQLNHIPYTTHSTETVPELQARSLRRRFALGYYFAATVAQLAWGAPPR
jgi:hypothetical protein